MPKRLEESRRRRAAAILEYTIAPAIFLPIPAFIAAVALLGLYASGISPIGNGFVGAAAALLAIAIMLMWWLYSLWLIGELTDRSPTGKFFIGLCLATASPLLSLIAVGLPLAAIFYWLIMYYSLSI